MKRFVILYCISILSFPIPSLSLDPPKRVRELGKKLSQDRSREIRRPVKPTCHGQKGKPPCSEVVSPSNSSDVDSKADPQLEKDHL